MKKVEKINVEVFIEKENKKLKIQLEDNAIVSDLLRNLRLNPVTVIIARNNELLWESEKLCDNDKINILSVISGG
jgi:thiamine biosynthesis protein ThiS